ncbi:hypothetical protein A3A71_00765 [Candidatus Berkelbacteria bacterium RIFCSPLOWO2_01_FULL_50_28]|uniref:Uncharacterized protein n=1 Tax=Candidatus Berkelbacteria bacterium RIFCSPLOWO2_01_FULL_50_28 TaxID=1797471 RepID=A0A1F5EB32_9BACT|nr:MAG: hypothetical protein A2807_00950 [Candidatus Berkelbacteria bacterium RIFCSPHIGHO2_01_FULL_50_36]OGD62886.1 MAG: hypothetical protein A3F39_03955 [Candidatus Berkelbacteria bacterium RIFCSPHIGHO2_12_FULL_50_11]OGD64573.1 MAG: hypothetical protein A3A71_00765 [Candidatus Berkelbacteria bacterium RIFCSPLOWO2_01_FULL_50_28]
MEGTYIHEFWAVTGSWSLYHVTDELNDLGFPNVEKVGSVGVSKLEVGARLKNGRLVGITDSGLTLFNPGRRSNFASEVNVLHWGGTTTPFVGLFLDEETARECLNLNIIGPIFEDEFTKCAGEVVRGIAQGHLVFRLDPAVCKRFGLKALEVCPSCTWAGLDVHKHTLECHPEVAIDRRK